MLSIIEFYFLNISNNNMQLQYLCLYHYINIAAIDSFNYILMYFKYIHLIYTDKKHRFKHYQSSLLFSLLLFPITSLPVILISSILRIKLIPLFSTTFFFFSPFKNSNLYSSIKGQDLYCKPTIDAFLYQKLLNSKEFQAKLYQIIHNQSFNHNSIFLLRISNFIVILNVNANNYKCIHTQIVGLELQETTSCHFVEAQQIDLLIDQYFINPYSTSFYPYFLDILKPIDQFKFQALESNRIKLTGIIEDNSYQELLKKTYFSILIYYIQQKIISKYSLNKTNSYLKGLNQNSIQLKQVDTQFGNQNWLNEIKELFKENTQEEIEMQQQNIDLENQGLLISEQKQQQNMQQVKIDAVEQYQIQLVKTNIQSQKLLENVNNNRPQSSSSQNSIDFDFLINTPSVLFKQNNNQNQSEYINNKLVTNQSLTINKNNNINNKNSNNKNDSKIYDDNELDKAQQISSYLFRESLKQNNINDKIDNQTLKKVFEKGNSISLMKTENELDNILQNEVKEAFRVALKISLEQFIYEGECEVNYQELINKIEKIEKETIFEYDINNMEKNENKSDIFILELNNENQLSIYRAEEQNLACNLFQLNEYYVNGFIQNQKYELFYLNNDDEERYSIQSSKQLLKNIIVQSIAQPIGYAVYYHYNYLLHQ